MKTFTFVVSDQHAPALKSIIDEMTSIIGARLEGPHAYPREAALTRAAVTLGALRAAVSSQVARGDRDYA